MSVNILYKTIVYTECRRNIYVPKRKDYYYFQMSYKGKTTLKNVLDLKGRTIAFHTQSCKFYYKLSAESVMFPGSIF